MRVEKRRESGAALDPQKNPPAYSLPSLSIQNKVLPPPPLLLHVLLSFIFFQHFLSLKPHIEKLLLEKWATHFVGTGKGSGAKWKQQGEKKHLCLEEHHSIN